MALRVLSHLALALVLTAMLACQVRQLSAVLRSRRRLAAGRPARITGAVSVAIPLAVVLLLAARSWMIALDVASPAVAVETLRVR